MSTKARAKIEKRLLSKPGVSKVSHKPTSKKFVSIKTKFNGGKTVSIASVLDR
ncbi:hypothetical protein KAW50_06895 [candidate division WOR-3 bacterium]|nr:hypothetical protein [candidate division WOR-3 bacterium]